MRERREGIFQSASATPPGADLRFKLTDEASGQPIVGNVPGAWLDIGQVIQGQPGAEIKRRMAEAKQ